MGNRNADSQVIAGFGDEWSRFDQSQLSAPELEQLFDNYFNIFPWEKLPDDAEGFDLGCGSGRLTERLASEMASTTALVKQAGIRID